MCSKSQDRARSLSSAQGNPVQSERDGHTLQAAGCPPPTVRIGCIASHTIGKYRIPVFRTPTSLGCLASYLFNFGHQSDKAAESLSAHPFSDRSGPRRQNLSHLADRFAARRSGVAQATYVIERGRLPELSTLGPASFASFQVQRLFAMSESRGAA